MADLEHVRNLLAEVDALIRQAEKDSRDVAERLDRLHKERGGLGLTFERLGGKEARQPPASIVTPIATVTPTSTETVKSADAPKSWVHLDRTGAVQAALREIGRPADRNAIARVLWRHGRDDKLDDISAALSYLRRKREAERQSDGTWALLALAGAVGAAIVAASIAK